MVVQSWVVYLFSFHNRINGLEFILSMNQVIVLCFLRAIAEDANPDMEEMEKTDGPDIDNGQNEVAGGKTVAQERR
ncbi:hypothetical protein AAG906_014757 [Vitis piasezkii]